MNFDNNKATYNLGKQVRMANKYSNVDFYYGPYESTTKADQILTHLKSPGLTVLIGSDSLGYTEYWYQYQSGVLNLVEKSQSLIIDHDGKEIITFGGKSQGDKTLSLKSGVGISLQSNTNVNDSTITINTESNHTVLSKNTIIISKPSESFTSGYELFDYYVKCDFNNSVVKCIDKDNFVTSGGSKVTFGNYSSTNFKWTKSSNTKQYAGICWVKASNSCYIFDLNIKSLDGNTNETHEVILVVDTPTGTTFTFITTIDWQIMTRVGSITSNSDQLLAYLEIPEDFTGDITLTPKQYSAESYKGKPCCFEGTSLTSIPWSNTGRIFTLYDNILTSNWKEIPDDDWSNTTNNGYYYVDIIGKFGGQLTVGSKISDSVVNDFYLHTLEKRLNMVSKKVDSGGGGVDINANETNILYTNGNIDMNGGSLKQGNLTVIDTIGNISVATNNRVGGIKSGGDITVNTDGTVTVNASTSGSGTDEKVSQISINSGERSVLLSYNSGTLGTTLTNTTNAVHTTNFVRINSSNGNISTSGTITATGDISTTGGKMTAKNGFYESSDERLKNFTERIPIDLDKLSKLKKNYFTWKDSKNTEQQLGVSAQEICKLYPEIVSEQENGTLVVAYDKLSVIALAAIDELYKKNQELENRLMKLENKSM